MSELTQERGTGESVCFTFSRLTGTCDTEREKRRKRERDRDQADGLCSEYLFPSSNWEPFFFDREKHRCEIQYAAAA